MQEEMSILWRTLEKKTVSLDLWKKEKLYVFRMYPPSM